MLTPLDRLPAAPLDGPGHLGAEFRKLGCATFRDAARWVQRLPYGRNADRSRPELVLEERQGTCSTKHALLALLAEEQGLEVEMRLVFIRLDRNTSPAVAEVLDRYGVEFLPEAHCVLRTPHGTVDLTHPDGSGEPPEIFEEAAIDPEELGEPKVLRHRSRLAKLLTDDRGLGARFDLDQLWDVREACIAALKTSKS